VTANVASSSGSPRARRVVVVERDAHVANGHFPNRFAELAAAFAELGCVVDVLVRESWVHEERVSTAPFRVHRYRRAIGHLDRVVISMRKRGAGRHTIWGIADTVSTLFGALELRYLVRRLRRGGDEPDVVLVLTYDTMPALLALLTPTESTVVYEFAPPMAWTEPYDRVANWWLASRWCRRRRASTVIATPDAAWRDHWRERIPTLAAHTATIAGVAVRRDDPDPTATRARARRALGIGVDERIVLLFGSGHSEKNLEVVVRAWALREYEGARLLVGGRIADALPSWPADTSIRVRGFVASDVRDQLYEACDVVLLTFDEDFRRDSGTLMDAIGAGKPVVVSRGSTAAVLVEQYGLGVVYAPGDERALVHALRQVPTMLAPDVLQRAREELSDRAVAQHFLDLADSYTSKRHTPNPPFRRQ
jgi:glycosyltransferase involved in cell wall biosynthesis